LNVEARQANVLRSLPCIITCRCCSQCLCYDCRICWLKIEISVRNTPSRDNIFSCSTNNQFLRLTLLVPASRLPGPPYGKIIPHLDLS
jgi:hypothetical protein